MEITDLFGAGAYLSGGKLIIPRQSLTDQGLSPTNTDPAAILASIILLVETYFKGSLLDSDGAELLDFDGQPLFFLNNRTDSELSMIFAGRRFDSEESFLYYKWLISFYELI